MPVRTLDLRGRMLKEATRTLHESVGGVVAAEAVTGISNSQHSNYHSHSSLLWAPIDAVARLEAVAPRDAAWPAVTRLLCEYAGGVFVPLPDVEAHDGPVVLAFMAVAKEFGQLAEAMHDGLADGTLEPPELLRLKMEGSQLQALLAALLQQVDRMMEATPPTVSQLRARES